MPHDPNATLEERIAEAIANAAGQGQRDTRPLLGGVPEDHVAVHEAEGPPTPGPIGPPAPQPDGTFIWSDGTVTATRNPSGRPVVARQPIYRQDDEWMPAGWTVERRARLQRALAQVGLLDGTVQVGRWTKTEADAFRDLLSYANTQGFTWEQAVRDGLENPDLFGQATDQPQEPGFVRLPFAPPDPAAVRASIRETARVVFGGAEDVELSDVEVDFLRGQYETLLRGEAEAEEANRLATLEAQRQAAETGRDVTPDLQPVPDAAARFTELFHERYKPKIDRLREIEEGDANRQLIQSNISRLMQYVTGRT